MSYPTEENKSLRILNRKKTKTKLDTNYIVYVIILFDEIVSSNIQLFTMINTLVLPRYYYVYSIRNVCI